MEIPMNRSALTGPRLFFPAALLATLLYAGPLLAETRGAVDERGLWTAYERKDYQAVSEEISVLRRLHPSWQPPRRLVALVQMSETNRLLTEASTAGRWAEIIRLRDERPEQFSCTAINNLWLAAEAHLRLGNLQKTYDIYETVITQCSDGDLRLSTLQKALAHRDDRRLNTLFSLESNRPKTPEQMSKLAKIEQDFQGIPWTRPVVPEVDRLNMALGDLAAGKADKAKIDWIERTTLKLRDVNAATTLGWRDYDARRLDSAHTWFAQSMQWKETPRAASGLAQVKLAVGDFDGAEQLARQWVDSAPELSVILTSARDRKINEAFKKSDYPTVLTLSQAEASRYGLLRGWSFHRLHRPAEAAREFEAAREAGSRSGDSKLVNEAGYGLAVTWLSQGLTSKVHGLIDANVITREQAGKLKSDLLNQEALDAYKAGAFREALTIIAEIRKLTDEQHPPLEIEAWSLYNLRRFREAGDVFKEIHRLNPTPETEKWLKLADDQYRANMT
jgi:cellulose synthase operon protein C